MQFFTSLVVIALAFTGIATASPATNVKINKPTVSKPVINKPDVKNTSQEVTCGNNMTPFCCVTDFSTAAGDKNKKNGGSKGKETSKSSPYPLGEQQKKRKVIKSRTSNPQQPPAPRA